MDYAFIAGHYLILWLALAIILQIAVSIFNSLVGGEQGPWGVSWPRFGHAVLITLVILVLTWLVGNLVPRWLPSLGTPVVLLGANFVVMWLVLVVMLPARPLQTLVIAAVYLGIYLLLNNVLWYAGEMLSGRSHVPGV